MRCYYCNHCPETDGSKAPLYLERKTNRYVCRDCATTIGEAIGDFLADDFFSSDYLEQLDVLEEHCVGEDQAGFEEA